MDSTRPDHLEIFARGPPSGVIVPPRAKNLILVISPPPVLVWCFRRPFVGCEIGPGLIGLGGMRLPNFSSVPPSGAVDPPWDESYLPITTIYLIWGWRCCPMAGTNFGLGALYREVSCEIFVRSTSSGSLSSPRFDCIQPNTPPILLS